jgi:DDE superfamily endonuclease
MWCVAELDDEYIAKMEDVLALYEKPYRSTEPVICLDEKPVSLHADVRPCRPARPGHLAKRDNEYKRRGTANIFAIVEPKAGRHFTCATPNRSAAQFARVVQRLVADHPFALKIHLVLDNLNIHCRKSLTDHLGHQEGRYIWSRLKVHYTPKHGSWLNQAEIELSLVSRQCLGTRRIPTLDLLTSTVKSWNAKANRDRTCIQWKFTRKAARTKFGHQRNTSKRSKT